MAFNL